jgi:hypothetical protein
LYNYINNSNRTRAIPFFKRLNINLIEAHFKSSKPNLIIILAAIFNAISIAIYKILKRIPRAIFHDDLPNLINFLKNISEITGINNRSIIFQIIAIRVAEFRAIIAYANNLLNHDELYVGGVSTIIVISTYSREIALPEDRHDNNKIDIIKVKILPTKDEIQSDHIKFLPSTDPDQPHFLTDPTERYLNIHFRLLRHDIFGKLK